MKGVIGLSILCSFISLNVYAVQSSSIAEIKQDMRTSAIKIEGTLKCDMGAGNAGQSCVLELIDSKTGAHYSIVNANVLMRTFNDGTKNIRVEAEYADNNSAIEIKSFTTF